MTDFDKAQYFVTLLRGFIQNEYLQKTDTILERDAFDPYRKACLTRSQDFCAGYMKAVEDIYAVMWAMERGIEFDRCTANPMRQPARLEA